MTSQKKENDGKVILMNKYTKADIAKHNKPDDCWIILGSKVYNVTRFLEDHPGGSEVLLDVAGKNATDGFIEAGHITNYSILQIMKDFLIGLVSEDKNPKL